MDRLISEQAIVNVLRKGYWDKNLQSAKDDPCVIDAMIDWAIRQIKAIPSAEPSRDMKEIEEVINCNTDAETKCKMISNIVYSKPHYFKILEQKPKIEKAIEMRDATPEERESIDKYIKSISKPTGIEFDEEQEQIDFVQPKKTIPCTIKIQSDRKQIYKKSAELRRCENLYDFVKLTQSKDAVSRQTVKEQMIKYGFHAPDMTITEFIEDELPSVAIPQDGEYIQKSDVLDFIDEVEHKGFIGFTQLKRYVEELPSVAIPSIEPKTGCWIAQDIYNCHTDFKCSECGHIHSFMHLYGKPTADYTYCPCCGAKMD